MAEVKIVGTTRTEFGKGAARRARRAGLVPAVIYGRGEEPLHITLSAKELGVALKQSNVLLDITIDGENELTLPKVIVRDFLNQTLEHVDLVWVRRGEKVVVSVPVRSVGEHDRDGILEHVNNSIEVSVDASFIPSFLELDIEGLAPGYSKYAADLVLPKGVELESDPEMIIVHLSERPTTDEDDLPASPASDTASVNEDTQ
jgi:large subunit ribosomal protein L25